MKLCTLGFDVSLAVIENVDFYSNCKFGAGGAVAPVVSATATRASRLQSTTYLAPRLSLSLKAFFAAVDPPGRWLTAA